MQLDPARYSHHLDGYDLSDEAKQAFMEQLWSILGSFVDRAFGESSEQILLGVTRCDTVARTNSRLDSVRSIQPTFNDAAADERQED